MKFYKCKTCGKVILMMEETPVSTVCCGSDMVELKAGETDGAVEKHVPVYEVKDGKVSVCVGSVAHPMLEEHHIGFIALETKKGCQIKYLKAGDEPKAEFALLDGDSVVAVYEYCNLHGLWKA
ncbi:MAG: desulfoferrodoxin [Treponema sp.]|nr:desulfoferrodoxin [Treponema sp.]